MTDFYANPMDAWRIRELLDQTDLSTQAVAQALDIPEEMLCRYRDGQERVPRAVTLALERLVGQRTKG